MNPDAPLSESIWARIDILVCRLIAGVAFTASGLAKAIDPWGTFYKISEYLVAWDCTVTRTLAVTAAIALGVVEFVLGALTLMGCFRRVAVWCLLAMMVVFLPLSAYIYIYDPVADCGCFGDWWVVSNGVTFWKNVVLTLLLILLAVYNRGLKPIFSPAAQWAVATLLCAYVMAVSLYGYNVQPLVDFRRFPVGTSLLGTEEDDDDTQPDYDFIYADASGQKRTFSADSLPGSDWTFVERKLRPGSGQEDAQDHGFTITNPDGEDITEEIVEPEGEQILILIPDLEAMDISHTYTVNRMAEQMQERGGTLTALVAGGQQQVHRFTDISMGQYPVYAAEPNLIKELARGNPAFVRLSDGTVRDKRTLDSAVLQHRLDARPQDGHVLLWEMTWVLLLGLLLLFIVNRSILGIRNTVRRRKAAKTKIQI